MEFRELSIQDKEQITGLFRDVFVNEPWKDDWSDPKQLDAYLADLITQNNSLTLGLLDGNQLVGLSMGHIKHWYAGTEYYIDEFCIDRNLQNKGIGSLFLNETEEFLKKRGIFHVFLQTDRDVPAYSFYLKRGFQELSEHVSFVKALK